MTGIQLRFSLALLWAVFLTAASAAAQCAPQWLPGAGMAGVDGVVRATTLWDPDGPGPAPPVLAIGGSFRVAGTAPARNIATHDPVAGTWSALGTGTDYDVYALAALPNGDLVVGGQFLSAGGVPASRIARWDGTSWSPLGTGMDHNVLALAILPNGDLVAGGQFAMAGTVSANRIARWDGTPWSVQQAFRSPSRTSRSSPACPCSTSSCKSSSARRARSCR